MSQRSCIVGPYRFGYRRRDGASGKPVVFLHGFLGASDEFEEAMQGLGDDYDCLAVDLPGHGRTRVDGGEANYAMAATARGLTELLGRLEVKPCVLIGYSMGGRLALYLAVHFPALFERVVLVSASPGLKTAEERRQRRERDDALAARLCAEGVPTFLQHWYAQPLFESLRAHPDFAAVLARRHRNVPQELARSLRGLGTGRQPSLWPRLAEIRMPLLLLAGREDPKFVARNAEVARLCPAARLETLAECGHALHLERPKAFVRRLRHFLAEVPTS